MTLESTTEKQSVPHAQRQGFERTEHPHIVRVPGVCGGEPIIEDTRISVRLIAGYYKEGLTVEEILRDYPHLSAAAVHDAISFYLDHQAEIDQLIEANLIDNVLEREGLMLGEEGVIYQPEETDG